MRINRRAIDPKSEAGKQLLDALKAQKRDSERAKLELALLAQLDAAGLTSGMQRQYKFLPERRYRADFAWPEAKLIAECDGGIYMRGGRGGGHNTGVGYEHDRERDNLAQLAGWRVLRFTKSMIEDGSAVRQIAAALA